MYDCCVVVIRGALKRILPYDGSPAPYSLRTPAIITPSTCLRSLLHRPQGHGQNRECEGQRATEHIGDHASLPKNSLILLKPITSEQGAEPF